MTVSSMANRPVLLEERKANLPHPQDQAREVGDAVVPRQLGEACAGRAAASVVHHTVAACSLLWPLTVQVADEH